MAKVEEPGEAAPCRSGPVGSGAFQPRADGLDVLIVRRELSGGVPDELGENLAIGPPHGKVVVLFEVDRRGSLAAHVDASTMQVAEVPGVDLHVVGKGEQPIPDGLELDPRNGPQGAEGAGSTDTSTVVSSSATLTQSPPSRLAAYIAESAAARR